MSPRVLGATAATVLALLGCTEKPQVMSASAAKRQAGPWTVSDAANPAFTAAGWTVGDKTSWEDHMRQRNQRQNEYAR